MSKKSKKIVAITVEEFRACRKHLGETQPQFAQRFGYASYRTIYQKEAGKRSLTYRDEELLKEYLPLVRELLAKKLLNA